MFTTLVLQEYYIRSRDPLMGIAAHDTDVWNQIIALVLNALARGWLERHVACFVDILKETLFPSIYRRLLGIYPVFLWNLYIGMRGNHPCRLEAQSELPFTFGRKLGFESDCGRSRGKVRFLDNGGGRSTIRWLLIPQG